MDASRYIHTLGHALRARHGRRVHKVALDVGFTCPNRDGSKGRGGCTFCNNDSFTPGRRAADVTAQIDAGARALRRHHRARKLLAYFQAYTNTYAELDRLRRLYDEALAHPDVVGLSIGTRPDCVPQEVLDLLADYRARGHDIWLELGLQSAFDDTLARVNRGHGFAEYAETTRQARARGLPVCTHLILGLPGESERHARETLARVLAVGTDGLKLHPLHVVKSTMLAYQWKRGEYAPMQESDYVEQCIDLISRTPPEVVYHRITGTASADILLAPAWCEHKWPVINAITAGLATRGLAQGSALGRPYRPEDFT